MRIYSLVLSDNLAICQTQVHNSVLQTIIALYGNIIIIIVRTFIGYNLLGSRFLPFIAQDLAEPDRVSCQLYRDHDCPIKLRNKSDHTNS